MRKRSLRRIGVPHFNVLPEPTLQSIIRNRRRGQRIEHDTLLTVHGVVAHAARTVVEGKRPIFRKEERLQVCHGREDGKTVTPTARITPRTPPQTEIGSGSDYLLRRVRRLQVAQGQHGLGLIERNALLQGLLQARQFLFVPFVDALRLAQVHIYGIFTHGYRIGAHVPGPDVERATGIEVETRVVPVARQNAVLADAARQRKAHVRAAVVHGVRALVVPKHGNGMPLPRRRHNPLLLQFRERRHSEQPFSPMESCSVGALCGVVVAIFSPFR